MSDYYGTAEILESLEAELLQVLTLDGVDYPCLIGSRTDSHELGLGGFATGSGIEVVMRRALFNEQTLPALDDVVYINYKSHKIQSVVLSPDGSVVVLSCDDANKDA